MIGIVLAFSAAVSTAAQIELKKGDVVAFVGGTDMVRMQQDGLLEGCLTQRFLDKKPKFRDLAWDGDTVYFQSTVRERWRKEAFGDWRAQLKRVGATVVIAQFGKIESLDGVGRIDEFKAAYGKLLGELKADGRRVVLLAPSAFAEEWQGVSARAALAEYTQAVKVVADEHRVLFVADDGKRLVWSDSPAMGFARALADGSSPRGGMINAIVEKHRLWYDYWRPANWKCLYGDDGKRIFGNAAEGLPSFKQEWSIFPALIAAAEENIYAGKAVARRQAPGLSGSAEADVAAELAAFEVLEGYEVNLFADESRGIANPLSLRWDPDGRMYVACSDVYPQIEPGVMPNDRVMSLMDTDGDGEADESALFAEGLNIPTGMEVGPEGIYVGQNTELILLDWKGNRRVLLSGFGNGDSHQTINSFVWSPDGELWFCQGDGIESRVETPFGVSSLFQAGVFRLRPRELRLDGLLDDFMGPGNPWGVAFDDFGQSFVIDGAGGISYLTPASIPAKRRLRLPRIGKPGGYCGVECVGDGEFLIGDYKKNQVSRFRVIEDGAGFKVDFEAPLLRSKHRNFRPIDVKLGPDGAIYIVDWYNPITCHQDDFYRHPNRDKTHGRIWRVAKKQAAAEISQPLIGAGEFELVERLKSDNRWIRLKAKQVLASKGLKTVPAQVRGWGGRDLLEAVALLEMVGIQDLPLLEKLSRSEDHRARAYAARTAGKWGSYALLEKAANDPHPRVRMESILACGQIPKSRSILIAATAAEHPRDGWIDYAFAQAVHHLKPQWMPAFRRGELDFGDRRRGLAAVLGKADSKELLNDARRMLSSDEINAEGRIALLKALLAVGEDASDMRLALETVPPNAELLRALAARDRPDFDVVASVRKAMGSGTATSVKVAALELARRWRIEELRDLVAAQIGKAEAGSDVHGAAIRALGTLGGKGALEALRGFAAAADDPQATAIAAMLEIDADEATQIATTMLVKVRQPDFARAVFAAFASRKGGLKRLADRLAELKVDAPQGKYLHEQWIATGLVDPELSANLEELAHIKAAGYEFSDGLVKKLAEVGKGGDPKRGQALFASARAGCAACHKVGEKGGVIGPDLSAVGSGVLPERIVTELLWPARLVKEGYSLTRVTLKDQSVLQGYVQKSRDEKVVLLRDFATGSMHEIPKDKISKSESLGSLMPAVAQGLSEKDIADLCAFLFGLNG